MSQAARQMSENIPSVHQQAAGLVSKPMRSAIAPVVKPGLQGAAAGAAAAGVVPRRALSNITNNTVALNAAAAKKVVAKPAVVAQPVTRASVAVRSSIPVLAPSSSAAAAPSLRQSSAAPAQPPAVVSKAPRLGHQPCILLGGVGLSMGPAAALDLPTMMDAGVDLMPRQQQQQQLEGVALGEEEESKDVNMSSEDMDLVNVSAEGSALALDAFDVGDATNPQFVTEYVQDIMQHLKAQETVYQPSHEYLSKHKNLTPRMREILIDWLVEVHDRFRLRRETLFLMVNVIDRFLELRNISRTKLQLLGCAGLLVAAKYEEIYAPQIRDFVHVTDNAYTREEILTMESTILAALKFNLTVPSADRFAERFAKVAGADSRLKLYILYLCELSLPHYQMLHYVPSLIAASATYLALRLHNSSWTPMLEKHTGYSEQQLQACACDIYTILTHLPDNKYKAAHTKYSKKKYGEVAFTPVKELHF